MNKLRFGVRIMACAWVITFLFIIAFWSSVFYFIYKFVG